MKDLVNFLNEVSMLAHTPRSGFPFLGSGSQSVAEHSYGTAMVGLALAAMTKEPVDRERLLCLCLFHDFPEARTGDLNYVHRRYLRKDDAKALRDMAEIAGEMGRRIIPYVEEYERGETLEARLAKDADQLELLLILKRESDTGNDRALVWFENVAERLRTDTARELATQIRVTSFDAWWFEQLHGSKS